MQRNRHARSVLGLLALLPDGLPENMTLQNMLQLALRGHSSNIDFDDALKTLKWTGLAYAVSISDTPNQIRVLSPIRDLIVGNIFYHPSREFLEVLVNLLFSPHGRSFQMRP